MDRTPSPAPACGTPNSTRCIGNRRDRSTRPAVCDQSGTSVYPIERSVRQTKCALELVHAAGYRGRRNRKPLRGRATRANQLQYVISRTSADTSTRQHVRPDAYIAWLFRSSASFCTLIAAAHSTIFDMKVGLRFDTGRKLAMSVRSRPDLLRRVTVACFCDGAGSASATC